MTNPFRPAFKLLRRDTPGRQTGPVDEPRSKTPDQRLLEGPDIPEAAKRWLPTQRAQLNPIELKKSREAKRQKSFTVGSYLDRESTNT